ncbi:MAG: MOSC domain-containing protein [Planctomycetota bacterium]|nr:MAG: MOSC domain-containing protein [Planctomycetota bacterium]
MSDGTTCKVLAIAIKPAEGAPMEQVAEAVGVVDAGLEGNAPCTPDRGVTFISSKQWREVCEELGADLPWHTRRANILLDAGGLAGLVGRRVRVGEMLVEIKGESKPCGLMDKLHAGLRAALKPHARGGVFGRVVEGGAVRVGDSLTPE